MPKYRNANTDDVVEYDQPNPRLEALDNWSRVDEPKHAAKPEPEPEPDAKPAPRRRKS